MLKNYLKIALRTLGRYRGYTSINVGGLALGMACCLLIMLYVRDELSFDRFHDKADQIYRIERLDLERGERRARADGISFAELVRKALRLYLQVDWKEKR